MYNANDDFRKFENSFLRCRNNYEQTNKNAFANFESWIITFQNYLKRMNA